MKTILVDGAYCFTQPQEDGSFAIDQELYELLETFPNPKIILTGANDEQLIKFALNDVPYPVFTLKHNPEKTDPKYYETLLKKFNLKAGDCLYFEHDKGATVSAKSAGIETIIYTGNLEEIKKFLEKVKYEEKKKQ